MNKDEALQVIKSTYAHEMGMGSLSVDHAAIFQRAIESGKKADALKVLALYQGEGRKTSLQQWDFIKLSTAVNALNGKKEKASDDELLASTD